MATLSELQDLFAGPAPSLNSPLPRRNPPAMSAPARSSYRPAATEREAPFPMSYTSPVAEQSRQRQEDEEERTNRLIESALAMNRQPTGPASSSSGSPGFNPLNFLDLAGGSPGAAAAAPNVGAAGSGAAVSGGYPSFGATGVGSGAAGAPGGAAASGAGASGGAGGLAAAAPFGYALAIGAGKMLENKAAQNDPDNPLSMMGMGLLGPSLAQYKEDPELLALSAFGLPFLTPFFASDEAKQADPEFAGLWRQFGLPFS